MFAIAAAVLFVVAILIADISVHSYVFWMLLGFIAMSLHFAFDIALPRFSRQAPPAR